MISWHGHCIYLKRRRIRCRHESLESIIVLEEWTMWTKPDFTEMRFGFEITMYIGNR